jgi:hypothetical protein
MLTGAMESSHKKNRVCLSTNLNCDWGNDLKIGGKNEFM